MKPSLLKRLIPQSLFGRFLLIILAPMVLAQLIATYMFYERHWDSISRNMSASLAGEIAIIASGMRDAPPESRKDISRVARKYLGLDVRFRPGAKLLGNQDIEKQYQLLAGDLHRHIALPFHIGSVAERNDLIVAIALPDGLLEVEADRKRIASSTTYIFISWMTGTGLIFLLIAVFFLRNQVATITRLAKVAEKFGKGQDVEHFKPRGASEVRRAAHAFNEMRERIRRLLTQRTEMLAGVSHDLKTPLTRMKLTLSMLEQNDKTFSLRSDVEEMERMIKGYLDFARGSAAEETSEMRLSVFLNDVLDGYAHEKYRLRLQVQNEHTLHVRYGALKRCLNNLINNALRYGSHVEVSTYSDESHVIITVDDDGPGIPPEKYREVFRPFYRLEGSRNPETGGVGLGLSIARDVVHAHGGEITLSESPMGGLRVTVALPV